MSIVYFRKRDNEQMALFRTLASLLAAGAPLVEALDECRDMAESGDSRQWLKRVRDRVNAGEPFSTALSAEPAIPRLISALVQTAESSGTLANALQEAADILELRHEWSQNVVSALIYPAVIMTVTLAATLFLALAVTPQIAAMYDQANRQLPLLTRMSGYTAVIAAGLIAGGLIALFAADKIRLWFPRKIALNETPPPRRDSRPSFFYKIRLLKRLNNTHATALWTHSLGILLSHGVPLPDALELSARTASPSSGVAAELREVRRRIVSGENPGRAFQAVETAPHLARRLLAGGDAAGNLPDACDRVYRIYDAEYRARAKRLTALAEPVAVVIAGCFVILAALAVILPIAELGSVL